MSEQTSATTAARANRRAWTGLVVLALPAMLIAMDLSVLYLAVPQISADLQPSSTELLWITDIYGFVLAGFLVTMGTLGDRIGRRRLLMLGAGAFGIASLFAAYATSAAMLIGARAVLGVAGATLGPSTLALISTMFRHPKERSFAIAVWSMSLSVGGALGPVVGGLLLEWFWWGSAFLIAVPVMAVLLALAPLVLPEHRDTTAGRPDVVSVVLMLTTILPIIYALKAMVQGGRVAEVSLTILVGVAAGVAFVRRQRVVDDPLLEPSLFRIPSFIAAIVTNALGFFIVLGIGLFFAQYLQLVLGLSPVRAALWTVPMFAAFALGALLSPIVVGRFRPARAIAAGCAVTMGGSVTVAVLSKHSGLAPVVVGSVIIALGLAPIFPFVTNLLLAAVSPKRAGAASGMAETSTEFGGALGIAVLGVVGTAVYRHEIAASSSSSVDLPPYLVNASRDTLGAAVTAAAHAPDHLGEVILHQAREAFTNGLAAVAWVCAAVAVLLAILDMWLLRGTRPTAHKTSLSEHESQGEPHQDSEPERA